MGFDSNGNWTSDFYPETDRDNSIPILASKFQKLIQTDIKSAFDNCLTRDGAGKPESNLNFNGHKITNLAEGELAQDAITVRQVQKGQVNYAADTSVSANSIVVNITPHITAYTAGQRFYFKVANTNTLSEVSFIANGLNPCRIQMDGQDNIVAGSLKQNCIYEGVYAETGNTAEATYAGRRIQVLSSASDLAATLNHTQVTNCILAAPNGVATQAGLVVTLKSAVRFLMYHGLNADGSIDNVDYTTSADATYTFAGTEADGTYYLFVDNSGVITPSTSFSRQTDKAIFAECEIESGAIDSFTAYGVLELVTRAESDLQKAFIIKTYANSGSWYRVWSDGWCEQGGHVNRGNTDTVNLLVTMADTNYSIFMFSRDGHVYAYQKQASSTTSFKFNSADDNTDNNDGTFYWEVKGYKAS